MLLENLEHKTNDNVEYHNVQGAIVGTKLENIIEYTRAMLNKNGEQRRVSQGPRGSLPIHWHSTARWVTVQRWPSDHKGWLVCITRVFTMGSRLHQGHFGQEQART